MENYIQRLFKIPIVVPHGCDLSNSLKNPAFNQLFLANLCQDRKSLVSLFMGVGLSNTQLQNIVLFVNSFCERWLMLIRVISAEQSRLYYQGVFKSKWRSFINSEIYVITDLRLETYLWGLDLALLSLSNGIYTKELDLMNRKQNLEAACRCINGICIQQLLMRGEYNYNVRHTGILLPDTSALIPESDPLFTTVILDICYCHLQMMTLDYMWDMTISQGDINATVPVSDKIGFCLWLYDMICDLKGRAEYLKLADNILLNFLTEYEQKAILWVAYYYSFDMLRNDRLNVLKTFQKMVKVGGFLPVGVMNTYQRPNELSKPVTELNQLFTGVITDLERNIKVSKLDLFATNPYNVGLYDEEEGITGKDAKKFIQNWRQYVANIDPLFYKTGGNVMEILEFRCIDNREQQLEQQILG